MVTDYFYPINWSWTHDKVQICVLLRPLTDPDYASDVSRDTSIVQVGFIPPVSSSAIAALSSIQRRAAIRFPHKSSALTASLASAAALIVPPPETIQSCLSFLFMPQVEQGNELCMSSAAEGSPSVLKGNSLPLMKKQASSITEVSHCVGNGLWPRPFMIFFALQVSWHEGPHSKFIGWQGPGRASSCQPGQPEPPKDHRQLSTSYLQSPQTSPTKSSLRSSIKAAGSVRRSIDCVENSPPAAAHCQSPYCSVVRVLRLASSAPIALLVHVNRCQQGPQDDHDVTVSMTLNLTIDQQGQEDSLHLQHHKCVVYHLTGLALEPSSGGADGASSNGQAHHVVTFVSRTEGRRKLWFRTEGAAVRLVSKDEVSQISLGVGVLLYCRNP